MTASLSHLRYKRSHLILAACILAVGVLAVGVLTLRAWLAAPPRVVGLEETIDRYRQSTTTATTTGAAQPVAGVYEYDTSGEESIDALGGDVHHYPPGTAMTITAEGCGYRMTWAPLEGRIESSLLCPEHGGVALVASTTGHEFFRQSDQEEFVCDPGAWWLPPPGVTTWTARCSSDDRVSTRSGQLIGFESVRVGAMEQSSVHIRYDDILSQGSTGTTTSDLWLDPQTGLVLRESNQADTRNDSVIGPVAFHERIDLTLRSLGPHT
jgi:hypothetical protein